MSEQNLKTSLLGFSLNSPLMGASGTFGYGVEYAHMVELPKLGAVCGKGLTLHGQYGNEGERLWETPSGLMNSIGLQNPGVEHFIQVELPEMEAQLRPAGVAIIANLGGHSEEEYEEGAALLSASSVDMIELNISCPNVKQGGMVYGVKAEAAAQVVRRVRAACTRAAPLIWKSAARSSTISLRGFPARPSGLWPCGWFGRRWAP